MTISLGRWLCASLLASVFMGWGCEDDNVIPDDAQADAMGERDMRSADMRDADPPTDGGAMDADDRDADDRDADRMVDADVLDAATTIVGCEGLAALFCEDFEAVSIGGNEGVGWRPQSSPGSGLAVEDTRPFAGQRSLHVHTEENGFAFMRILFDPPANSFFGRMRVWVTEFPTAPNWAHFTLVEATGDDPQVIRPVGGQYVPAANGGPGSFWGIGADRGPTGDWTHWRTSAPAQSGAWTCIEWEMRDSDSFIQLRIGGADNPELTVDATDHGGNDARFEFPQFHTVKVGWQLYQGSPMPSQYDLWIDDVAFADTRLPCN